MPGGMMPGGVMPGGMMPGGMMPGGMMPGGMMPGGMMPGARMPGGMMSGGIMPGGIMPGVRPGGVSPGSLMPGKVSPGGMILETGETQSKKPLSPAPFVIDNSKVANTTKSNTDVKIKSLSETENITWSLSAILISIYEDWRVFMGLIRVATIVLQLILDHIAALPDLTLKTRGRERIFSITKR